MQVYYDKDADIEIIKNKKVVIVGYVPKATLTPIISRTLVEM